MKKYCENCGKEVSEQDVFCTHCGKKIEDQKKTTIQTTNINNGSNGLAIAGFVLSLVSTFLCCGAFNTVSLILSIVGLTQAPKYNGKGKSLAIAGIIISGIVIALHMIFSRTIIESIPYEIQELPDTFSF